MVQASCEINPDMEVSFLEVGTEKTPVFVIDNVLLETSSLIDYACHSVEFAPDRLTAYPGIRAQLPTNYTDRIVNLIAPLFRKQCEIAKERRETTIMEYFSLLTTPVNELTTLQRVPHFDSTSDHYFALVHYLNEGEFGGTGFFRHRPTGFERIYSHSHENYRLAAQAFVKMSGEPGQKYINSSDEHFELLDSVKYKANRIVAYPGNLLHSGIVNPDVDLGSDPETGRLTANLFIEFV